MTSTPPVPQPAGPIAVTRETFERDMGDLPPAARRAFRLATRIRSGRLDLRLPDGRRFTFAGMEPGPEAVMEVRDLGFARRLASAGEIGFAEAYLRGEWDSPDLTAFIELFALNHPAIATLLPRRPLIRLWQLFQHLLNRNTRAGAVRNIRAHYDLGNRFYEAWLDRTMTYSSAIFAAGDNDLASAQERKYRRLAQATGIEAGHHVLEIGCGWGGFAEFAAREIGCRVTGLTISPEQSAYARQRIASARLSERVGIRLQDYRDERGSFDRIVSIEMFEAVGEAYWDSFFKQMRDRLVAGGRAGLQVITIREEHFVQYRRELDFIRRFVFPGGMLPTCAIMRGLGDRFGLRLAAERAFGSDYARTLQLWHDRFQAAWPDLRKLGFDDRFRRLWEYYLSYCEAGFRSRNIDVCQMVYVKP